MTVNVEFDGELPFLIEFAEFMVASSMPKDAVKYTPQTLTEPQQAQARQNIGAARGTDESVLIGRDHTDESPSTEIVISAEKPNTDERGYITAGRVSFYATDDDQRVILCNIADGEKVDDAATVGQLNAVKPYIIPVYTGGDVEGDVIDGEFNWDELAAAVYANRYVVIMAYDEKAENGGIALNAANVHILPILNLDAEDGVAFFGITSNYGESRYTIKRDGTLIYDLFVGDSVSYKVQYPTQDEQTQARQNIGAMKAVAVTAADAGKFLRVSADGAWEAQTVVNAEEVAY